MIPTSNNLTSHTIRHPRRTNTKGTHNEEHSSIKEGKPSRPAGLQWEAETRETAHVHTSQERRKDKQKELQAKNKKNGRAKERLGKPKGRPRSQITIISGRKEIG
jgi:hypothetical protein